MPAPGAQPVPGYDALDLGRDNNGRWLIGTKYSDGSYVVWDADTEQEVAYIAPGRSDPADLGGGRAAVANPDGSLLAYDINNPPPQVAGTAPASGSSPAAPANPNAPTGPVGTRKPGEDFNYGPIVGRYAPNFGGQTVSPNNPLTRGAGVEGIPYGWGVPGFGQNPIQIRQANLAGLADPKLAPGYIPGSGTYNQYRLDTAPRFPGAPDGLFGEIPGQSGVVNRLYGQGGPGDPTNGSEIQTPQRWITGNAADSTVAMQGDDKWRATGGMWKGGGGMGGGWDTSWAAAPAPYSPGPGVSAGGSGWQTVQPGVDVRQRAGGGYDPGMGGMGGGGMGGGFFGSNVTSNWGQTPETAGLDFIATLFLRSDTPTGIGTPAWSAPPQMWAALIDEIRKGRIYVKDPQAWAMLAQKLPGTTPQSIGGAALGGQNVQPGSSTEDAIANGNAAEAAERAAYWAYQQSLLRQGDQRIALEEARDAWAKAYQTATMMGQLNGQDTMAMQQQRFAQGVTEAGLTGMYNGQKTQQAIAQENAAAQALLQLQSQMQGPRNWARYQSTFGSTPQGLRDVLAAYQGRYALPTGQGAAASSQGGKASVAGMAGDLLSGTYGQDQGYGANTTALGNPRQADIANWSRMQPSQREMILGMYEDQGWYGPDVENLLKGAAPKNAGPAGASYNFFQGA